MIFQSKQQNQTRAIWPVRALNFFIADVQAGLGPFLGVFLLMHGWHAGMIGTIMTIGGIAGMIATPAAGALIDSTYYKRTFLIGSAICSAAAACLLLLSQSLWIVTVSQIATAIAGAIAAPAVIGITLGIVRDKNFNRQNGINQVFNHAGNVAGAALSGFLGWRFGFPAVFYLAVAFAGLAILSTVMIPAGAIDYRAARGAKDVETDSVGHFDVLWKSKPLIILAVCLGFFHLGNAAMLPLYGLAVVSAKHASPASFTAMTIVVAQTTMVAASVIATFYASKDKLWILMLASFVALPIRGFIAAHLITPWGVYPVQLLDGVGAGLQSVAVPALVVHILAGTGRINIGQGAVMTVQGAGAAISPVIGGWLAQECGYAIAFLVLGAFAIISITIWLSSASLFTNLDPARPSPLPEASEKRPSL